jgi:hypothetical protein
MFSGVLARRSGIGAEPAEPTGSSIPQTHSSLLVIEDCR